MTSLQPNDAKRSATLRFSWPTNDQIMSVIAVKDQISRSVPDVLTHLNERFKWLNEHLLMHNNAVRGEFEDSDEARGRLWAKWTESLRVKSAAAGTANDQSVADAMNLSTDYFEAAIRHEHEDSDQAFLEMTYRLAGVFFPQWKRRGLVERPVANGNGGAGGGGNHREGEGHQGSGHGGDSRAGRDSGGSGRGADGDGGRSSRRKQRDDGNDDRRLTRY